MPHQRVDDGRRRGGPIGKTIVLFHVDQLQITATDDFAVIGLVHIGEDLQQCRFTGAIGANDAQSILLRHVDGYPFEQQG